MNSPLPFLFGLPPEDALERFNMTLEKDGRPEHNYVLLSATPRLRQDADNWSSAEIYLNTETFLPIAVKLVDPPKTKRTVYKFIDTKINRNEMIAAIMRNKPFEPNLRGYQIQMIQPGAGNADGPQGDVAQNKPVMNPSEDPQAAQVVPDVVGQPHHIAEKMLLAAGVEQGSIRKFKGQPAPRENLKFIVSNQKPAPGTPLAEAAEVHLLIFVEPAAAAPGAAAIQPANGIQR